MKSSITKKQIIIFEEILMADNKYTIIQINWMMGEPMGLPSYPPHDLNVMASMYYNSLPGPQITYLPFIGPQVKFQDSAYKVKMQDLSVATQKDDVVGTTPEAELPQQIQKKSEKQEHDQNLENKDAGCSGRRNTRIFRNALLSYTFNRVLKFIRNSAQSRSFVIRIMEAHGVYSKKSLSEYYKYAQETSKKVINIVSIQKIRDFWTGQSKCCQQRKFYHQIFRCLTRVYLERKFTAALFESQKFTSEQRGNYLRMKRCLLINLEHPAAFRSYEQF